ncbi:cupredoxin domain-containing protein [Deinococcus enclensis]|uniref:Plastocyanin n=1 Tax=Deinococcus enclensis TaxID=1049582 RepID=A0ABT9MGL5_9DEIO|nr:plastocyanin/azurin family copper-binding protein [Deinococcus enclensis]MDP9765728.1 plastocyanin [Deinococcus enclensis]
MRHRAQAGHHATRRCGRGAPRLSANRFEPATLRVKVGTTVVWQQEDTALHNVISAELPTLRSSDLRRGDTYRHTFTQAGTFTYYCSYHAGMTGTVIVTD